MLQAFAGLKTLVNSHRRSTESLVFFLHYRMTFLVLLFCCVLVSTQQFSGHKIQCLSKPSSGINVELLNSYCWAASTYSVRSSDLEEAGGVRVPHSGVLSTEKKSEREYRNFYQYVHIVLFIQAVLFYLPHLVWKSMERNFMSNVVNAFKPQDCQDSDASDRIAVDSVAAYIKDRWGTQRSLVLKYLFCEVMSAANVMAQSYLLDIFFRGKFMGLGLLVEAYYGSDVLSDPIRLFPLVTICNFRRYGPSGFIVVVDTLCVLPNNAINSKIYICLWIWFLVLLTLSGLSVAHLLFSIFVPLYRIAFPKMKSIFNGLPDNDPYTKVLAMGDFGDWFVLSSIGNNMDSLELSRVMESLETRLNSYETETKEAI